MQREDHFLNILSYKSAININLKYKDESRFIKMLSYILFFNPKFMTDFITTIGSTIYFPSRKKMEMYGSEFANLTTIAHEYVHVMDSEKDKLFKVKYLLPQILALLMLLFGFISWWIALALFVLFLCPLPAYWRKQYELRGYTMSLFMADQIGQELKWTPENRSAFLNGLATNYNKQFTSGNYYFMWPFGVQKELNTAVHRIISGDILNDDSVYRDVQTALTESII